jgi:hypothetical protein
MSTREWGLGLVMLAVSFGARAAHAQEIATDATRDRKSVV